MSEKPIKQAHPGSAENRIGEKVAFVEHSDLFRLLDATELREVERLITLATYAPGRILYRPGEQGSALFLIASGSVQLYHLSTDGRKLITATLGPGMCIGEMALLGKVLQTSFAEVVEESRIGVLSRHDAEQLLARYPSIALMLLKQVQHRFIQLETQLVDTTFKSVNTRLAALLLQLAGQTLIVDGLSHEALAERLGVYRETVSVALRDLKESGAIALGRKRITISNPSLLQELAERNGDLSA